MAAISRGTDLEASSLPIRETAPGKMVLDFDALADGRQSIMDELRTGILQSLGQRALDDLSILAGLDEFIDSGNPSDNVEIQVERDGDTLKIWTFIPGPGGSVATMTRSQSTRSYPELLEEVLKNADNGRFRHVMGLLPESPTPPP